MARNATAKSMGSNSVTPRACPALLDPRRTMLGAEQEAWLKAGLASSKARWNVLAQQTMMAQSSQIPVGSVDGGRFWTDGWDGYPVARRRLLDTLVDTRAANPLVLGGDVHTFYATELRRDFNRPVSAANPVVATEFVGTSVTSNSRPQLRTCTTSVMPLEHMGLAESLAQRLSPRRLKLPPLRERPDEMAYLVHEAVREAEPALQIHSTLIEACLLRPWPGNMRELVAEVSRTAHTVASQGKNNVRGEDLDNDAGHLMVGAPTLNAQAQPTAVNKQRKSQRH